jgi:L-asparaginase
MTICRPTVAVLTLGGTIGMMQSGDSGGLHPAIDGTDLLASLEALQSVADLRVRQLMNQPSPHLSFDDLCLVAQKVRDSIDSGADGVVVVQGTDSIEVTAFVLELLIDSAVPVVVTGAMRGAGTPGADGPANLSAAIQTAASPACRGLGVIVVVNDELHAARFVAKGHSSNPAAFVSDPGPIGRIIEGRPEVLLRPRTLALETFAADTIRAAPPRCVVHIPAEIDDDGALVRALLETGCDGIVVSGMGGGHVAPMMVPPLASAAARLPVILTTKCPRGGGLGASYGYAGAEIDLAGRGLIRAGWLTPSKARAALVLLLRSGRGDQEIRAFFSGFAGG